MSQRIFYVCSYGGSGSKLLCQALSKYGISIHIHSRKPPSKLEYVNNEQFNGIQIPENILEKYSVVFIYKNPVKAILSRFTISNHLKNIQVDPSIKLSDVIETKKDLYGINEFYNNYTRYLEKRNYEIYCVKYEELFEKQNELSDILNIGSLDLVKKETQRVNEPKLYDIYKNLILEMNNNPFIFTSRKSFHYM